jgi:hypothetical protein
MTDAEILNTMLWMYRRLPYAYGSPPFITQAIMALAERAGVDVAEFLMERLAIEQTAAPYDR